MSLIYLTNYVSLISYVPCMSLTTALESKEKSISTYKPSLTREDLKGVLESLANDQISSGEMAAKLEKVFSGTFQFKSSVSTNSLFGAYHLALVALDLEPGDKVVVPNIAPSSFIDAVYLVGATPIPVDLAKRSFHYDLEQLSEMIAKENPKLVFLNHPFGSSFTKSADAFAGVPVLEDISDVLGNTNAPGKYGKLVVTGLTTNSTITMGNGAILSSNDTALMTKVRECKFGFGKRQSRKFKLDYNLIDFQAALGLEQLSKLGVLLERKKKIAELYLQSLVGSTSVETYFNGLEEDSFSQFVVLIPGKTYDEAQRYFASLQISTKRPIDEPLHSILELDPKEFPNSERLWNRGHQIPLYPNLTSDNVKRIIQAIRRIY